MENLLDIHTHTLASGHAYSSLRENIGQAQARGLKIMGTSDHAKTMPGVGTNAFFGNYASIPRVIDKVIVLCGVEANIIDGQGGLDIDLDKKMLDYAIVSLHRKCIKPGTMEENTGAIIQALSHPKVKILGHPDDDSFPLDYSRLVEALVERGVYAEVNNSSLKEKSPRKGARKNLLKMLEIGRQKGLRLVLNSDAHIDLDVGNIQLSQALVEEVDYPREWILNYSQSPEAVLQALDIEMEK